MRREEAEHIAEATLRFSEELEKKGFQGITIESLQEFVRRLINELLDDE